MKKNVIKRSVFSAMGVVAVAAMIVVSCQKNGKIKEGVRPVHAGAQADCNSEIADVPVDANGIVTISTLTSDKIWKLNGVSYIGNGQTLTIQPGTTIVSGAKKSYNDPTYGPQSIAGILVVGRGGKLIADGQSAATPIVFTTLNQVCGGNCDTSGVGPSVVMIGKATTNRLGSTRVEGIPQPAGVDITYGDGSYAYDDADNSGILRYVRIEFPGFILRPDNEINGVTCAGVGSGTTISYVQVSYSRDDSYEFFGGTVNCDHLIAQASDDDDFDFDHGFTGHLSYLIGIKDLCSTHSRNSSNALVSDANGIEADNDAEGSGNTPKTRPVIDHLTELGYRDNLTGTVNPYTLLNGGRIRRNAEIDLSYSIVAGFPTGLQFDAPSNVPPSSVCHSLIHGFVSASNKISEINALNCGTVFSTATPANDFLKLLGGDNAFMQCGFSSEYEAIFLQPDGTVDPASPAILGGGQYAGAIDPTAESFWTDGWAKFNPHFCCVCPN
jgi:hypothetical protein